MLEIASAGSSRAHCIRGIKGYSRAPRCCGNDDYVLRLYNRTAAYPHDGELCAVVCDSLSQPWRLSQHVDASAHSRGCLGCVRRNLRRANREHPTTWVTDFGNLHCGVRGRTNGCVLLLRDRPYARRSTASCDQISSTRVVGRCLDSSNLVAGIGRGGYSVRN